jgi:ribosomal protein S18 acetylase RimI-like enzyme
MNARLRPMREDEFPDFLAAARAGYVEDLIRNGGLTPEGARLKAEADYAQLFPDGFPSGVELRVLEDESGRAVGRVVWAAREQHGSRYAFLYDVEVDEEHRGRGLGREAMQLLEAEVRGRGFERLQLNVFGGNERARTLYRSLGFEELSVQMGKELA